MEAANDDEHRPLLGPTNTSITGDQADGSGEEGEAQAEVKLRTSQVLMFGAPTFGVSIMIVLINTWLSYFWLPPSDEASNRIDPLGFAGAMLLGRGLAEGLWGVQVGYLSDHLVTRWGRRKPFLYFGTPLLMVAAASLYFPPTPGPSVANTAYLTGMVTVFGVMHASVSTTYQASIPEVTKTERLRLTSVSGVLSILGHIVTAFVGPVNYAFEQSYPDGLTLGPVTFTSGLQFWAVSLFVVLLLYYLPTFVIKSPTPEEFEQAKRAKADKSASSSVHVWSEVWHCLTNYTFMTAALSTNFFSTSANAVFTMNLPYLFETVYETENGIIAPGKGSLWMGLAILITVIGSLIGVPIVSRLAKKHGKRVVFRGANLFAALTATISGCSFLFADPAIVGFVAIGFLALPSAALFVLPHAIYADVVDDDVKRTGARREGVYAGTGRLIMRIGTAIFQVVFSLMLMLGKTPDNYTGVIVNTFMAAGLFLLSALVLSFHPINK